MCLTNNKTAGAVPITAPEGYTPAAMELLRRELQWATADNRSLRMDDLFLIRDVGGGKMDLNSGQISEQSAVSHRHGGSFPFFTNPNPNPYPPLPSPNPNPNPNATWGDHIQKCRGEDISTPCGLSSRGEESVCKGNGLENYVRPGCGQDTLPC